MKILFVAVFNPNSTNVAQSRGFKYHGHNVYEYDYRSKVASFGTIQRRDDDLIRVCKEFSPDLMIFSKANNLNYRVIDECNKITKTCLWYMDAMNNFDGELIDKIKRCTFNISGVETVTDKMLEYNQNSYFVNQCPDDKMNFPIEEASYNYDVTFIGAKGGSTHTDRSDYLQAYDVNHFDSVFGLEHNRIVNESKINLNFSPIDATGCSVRVYKILASGGFLMTTPWNNIEDTFKIDEDLVVFNNKDEYIEKLDYYLNNTEERNRIRMNGYAKSDRFSPRNWAKRIIEYYEKS
jgi:spore maturation protein CgeB